MKIIIFMQSGAILEFENIEYTIKFLIRILEESNFIRYEDKTNNIMRIINVNKIEYIKLYKDKNIKDVKEI